MTRHQDIQNLLLRLVAGQPWVFAVGLRIRFNHPSLLYQTYPAAWIAHYAKNGLLFNDPAVLWGMTNVGVCDWSALESLDRAGVLRQAQDFGLAHGIVVSVGESANRSLGFFARSDQPVTAAQRDLAQGVVTELHAASDGVADLGPAELTALAALNDQLTAPGA